MDKVSYASYSSCRTRHHFVGCKSQVPRRLGRHPLSVAFSFLLRASHAVGLFCRTYERDTPDLGCTYCNQLRQLRVNYQQHSATASQLQESSRLSFSGLCLRRSLLKEEEQIVQCILDRFRIAYRRNLQFELQLTFIRILHLRECQK